MKVVQQEKQLLAELARSRKRITVALHQAKWSVFPPESYAIIEKIYALYTEVAFIKVDIGEVHTFGRITTPVVMLYVGDVVVDVLQQADIVNLEKLLNKWLHVVDPAYRRYYASEALMHGAADPQMGQLMELMNTADLTNVFEKDAHFLQRIVKAVSSSVRSKEDNSMQLFKLTLNLLVFFSLSPDHALSQKQNPWLMKLLETTASCLDVRRRTCADVELQPRMLQ